VEAAVIMSLVLVPLFALLLLFGKFFWHYSVVQKAVHDATLFMAVAPLSEIRNSGAATVAAQIIAREMTGLDTSTTVEPYVNCGYKVSPSSFYMVFGSCSSTATPAAVQSFVIVTFSDPFFSEIIGRTSIQYTIPATMSYGGR
jgi:hypothetical protein